MSVRNYFLGGGFGADFLSSIIVKTFTCLGTNACVCPNSGRIPIRIATINGAGNYIFGSGKTIVGNVSTTETSIITQGEIFFENSTITSAGGIVLSGDSGSIVSGVIVSTPLFGYSTHSQNGTVRLMNFTCDFKLGFLKIFGGNVIIENSSIKSTNSPIAFLHQGNASVTLKNSTFEVVNSVPLITCGAGETRTVKALGVATNATMTSEQESTGVTIIRDNPTQITITTAVNITTSTNSSDGTNQKGKNVIIDNGATAINVVINGGVGFSASYMKHGSAAITFLTGSGRSLMAVDGTTILNGAVGSTATITSVGTVDYLRISNA